MIGELVDISGSCGGRDPDVGDQRPNCGPWETSGRWRSAAWSSASRRTSTSTRISMGVVGVRGELEVCIVIVAQNELATKALCLLWT